jgi:glycerol-3-phosphate acyltransferase PlsX
MSHAVAGRRIAVDAMGGDLGPAEVVAGVRLALERVRDLTPITLVGDEAVLRPLLQQGGLAGHAALVVKHAAEVITMDDGVAAMKRKRDASMLRAIELVKAGEAIAVVSTGNTKVMVAAGTVKLRPLEGIDRPALAPVVPRENGHFILIDAGANPEARVDHLVHNAILGSHYCRVVLGVKQPRVGLLSIGTEEGKGNELVAETHEALKRLEGIIRYTGPIEGFQLFFDQVDVVVCDGFVGNICLKSWESLAKFIGATLKSELKANPVRFAGATLAKGALDALKHRIQPERYGGAPLLGLRGSVFKAHGSSNREAIMNAIRICHEMVAKELNEHVMHDIARANELIAHPAA